MIRFREVRVRYPGPARPAVDGVSFDAMPGRITAVVGPNGSGKTTLVRALLGRVALDAGAIEVGGQSLATLDRRAIARAVAVVPQREEPVFPRTVREFVALGRFAHGSPWRGPGAADQAAIDDAIRRTDLDAYLGRRTDQLSGGEWQRVRVARALAQAAPALVLDEPNSFLDIAHEMALFELLDAIARDGTSVLLISHQLNLVARFAERVVLVSAGRVVADGSPADVMEGDLMEHVYAWPVVVSRDPAVGAPVLVPLRKRGPR
ncbi:MAG TPA: ABC transporter ATP-binding protein [Gemmatimonadaceae bacterium]|nr:ABC transporter ATP-binding protein [Gemmatimonadaceae bacterium]